MKKILLPALVLLTTACATGPKDWIADDKFLQIAKSPDSFDGRTVTIRAWITLRQEDRNLWATWQDHENWEVARCISLIDYDSLDDALDGHFVELTGVVRKDASDGGRFIRLASCRNSAIEIVGPGVVHQIEK